MRCHPTSQGRLCVRGWQVGDLATSPLQLRHPQIRRADALVQTSYETAVNTAAGMLRAAAGEVWVLGGAHLTNEEAFVTARLAADGLKTPYRGCPARAADDAAVCWLERSLGEPYLHPPLDRLPDVDAVVVLHATLVTQHPQADAWVLRAQRAGARLVVLDEVRRDLARAADLFVPLHPDGLVRALDFVAQGLRSGVAPEAVPAGGEREALAEMLQVLRQARRTAIVASMAALPEARVVRAAVDLAELVRGGQDVAEVLYLLRSEANSLGTTLMGLRPAPEVRLDLEELLHSDRTLAATVVVDDDLTRFVGVEGLQTLRPRLGKLIVLSAFPSPTTEQADVVLPVATVGQREGTVISEEGRVWLQDTLTGPPGQAKPVGQVIFDLAQGVRTPVPGPGVEQVWETLPHQVPAVRQVRLEALRAGEEVLVDREHLPRSRQRVEEPLEVPQLGEPDPQYEWTIIVRRDDNDRAFDPRMQAIVLLEQDMRRARMPYVGMSPEDMVALRLRGGAKLRLATEYGSAEAQVRRVDGLPAKTLLLPYHFADLRRALAGPGDVEGCGGRVWHAVRAKIT